MNGSAVVEVRTLEGHADERAATGWRVAGERYETTTGLARRRERAGLVEIEPDETPEEELEPQEDAQEAQEADDSEQMEAQDAGPETNDDEEGENG